MRRRSILRRFARSLLRLVPRFALRRLLRMSRAGGDALQASGALFAVAALLGSLNAWVHGGHGIVLYLRVLLDPARAVAGLLVMAWIFPEAIPRPRQSALYSLLVPTLFIAALAGLKVVAEGTGPPLVRFGEAPRADVMWRDPGFLLLVGVAQAALLYALTGRRK